MNASASTASNTARKGTDRDIIGRRVFDAPRELVWQLWTDPRHIARWWGPQGFTNTISKMDVRPGGEWLFVMHGPDGRDYQNRIVYREVVRPERIVYSHVSGPLFDATVTFTDLGDDRTEIEMRMVFESDALRDQIAEQVGAVEGLSQTLGRLAGEAEAIAARPFVITRLFDAPRQMVFDAWTDVEHLKSWWGPRGFTNPVCEVDVRPGGAIRIDMRGPDGTTYPMHGQFVEITSPERIAFTTDAMVDETTGELLMQTFTTVTFEEQQGKTKLTMRAFVTKATAAASQALAGMAEGWSQTLDRLNSDLWKTKSGGAQGPFVISRMFDAPRELMWKLWTEDDHLKRWWGPKGVTVIALTNDLRVGGVMHYGMRTPDGMEIWGKWIYREIVPPERITVLTGFSDPNGGLTRHPMAPEWPAQMLSTFTFDEIDGKTLLTIRWAPYEATDAESALFHANHMSMQMGWSGTFDQLLSYLGSVR